MRRTTAALGAGVALVLATPLRAQQRESVLKQVRVPHSYYWREMYVPQVTSGPSAVTWSPDGKAIAFTRVVSPHPGDFDEAQVHVVECRLVGLRLLLGPGFARFDHSQTI